MKRDGSSAWFVTKRNGSLVSALNLTRRDGSLVSALNLTRRDGSLVSALNLTRRDGSLVCPQPHEEGWPLSSSLMYFQTAVDTCG